MDRTYLSIGTLGETNIDVDVILPQHEEGNPYDFGFAYNISQKINGKNIYAICFYMKKYHETGVQLYNGDTLYHHLISYDDLINVEKNGIIPFKKDTSKVYISVIHDDQLNDGLIYAKSLFDSLKNDIIKLNSNGQPYVFTIPLQVRPRVVGMSVITR